jgi:hypothetical protein
MIYPSSKAYVAWKGSALASGDPYLHVVEIINLLNKEQISLRDAVFSRWPFRPLAGLAPVLERLWM